MTLTNVHQMYDEGHMLLSDFAPFPQFARYRDFLSSETEKSEKFDQKRSRLERPLVLVSVRQSTRISAPQGNVVIRSHIAVCFANFAM